MLRRSCLLLFFFFFLVRFPKYSNEVYHNVTELHNNEESYGTLVMFFNVKLYISHQ